MRTVQRLSSKSASVSRGVRATAMIAATIFAGTAWAQHTIQLKPIGTYATGIFNLSAAEISAYDEDSKRLFVVNAQGRRVDVLNLKNPSTPEFIFSIDLSPYGTVVNSVAVNDGVVAVAVENAVKTEPGQVVFFNKKGKYKSKVTVGALPDMVTFTPNGKYLLVANEGEPNGDYSVDPEGSISVIRVSEDADEIEQDDVRTADFVAFNNAKIGRAHV